ncbi:rhodanese-like domain-containing protein [Paenibacillus lautus]|uniref:rhodanese-like domain-containing protein n=1 Tax=Paenibacillus lautus TaxID=1401 RepID=UPI002DB59B69|nr:rhodanese-like domain-containing protein [Paenibacillus lautus]MEC0306916.1 rhodanese-like domain-containing protein [Paenibacillus lautus]
MDLLNIIFIALMILFIVWRILPAKGVRQNTAAQLKHELKDVNANKQFIDVRTTGEFKGNHIRGFRNIPLDQLLLSSESLSREKEVVLICQSGMRSNKASKILRKSGFQKVTNVKGGMSAWS